MGFILGAIVVGLVVLGFFVFTGRTNDNGSLNVKVDTPNVEAPNIEAPNIPTPTPEKSG